MKSLRHRQMLIDRNYQHGDTGTAEHNIWRDMLKRCGNPNNKRYAQYGGRGIKVCTRWHDYECFLADMGRRPSPDHSIERIDNNGDYCPGNCKWVTKAEQADNKTTTVYLTLNGERKSITEWSKKLGIPANVLHMRRTRLGWSDARTLTIPLRVLSARRLSK